MPREPLRIFRAVLLAAIALNLGRVAWAAPGASAPSATPARRTLPDYGGRSGSLDGTLGGAGGGAADPLAQAGRAFEALVIVLVAVAGGLVLLKRSGLIKGDVATAVGGGPASWASSLRARGPEADGGAEGLPEMLSLLGSRTLPHSPGAGLHLVAVGGRVLLLGATAQSVTLLTEVAEAATPPERETPAEVAAFADYLERLGMASPPAAGTGPAQATLSAATDRLQSLLAQGRNGGTGG